MPTRKAIEGQSQRTKKSNVRSRKPTTHAEGKPVRGIRPGKRGPNKKADEILAEKMGLDRVIVIPRIEPHAPTFPQVPGAIPTRPASPQKLEQSRNRKLNRQLQDLIRELGNEVVDPNTGWTRIIMVIKRLYLDAMAGKTQATALLLERGWGKIPTPIQMDMRAEVMQIMEATGLTQDELEADPILKEIMADAIDTEFGPLPGSPGSDGEADAQRPSEPPQPAGPD